MKLKKYLLKVSIMCRPPRPYRHCCSSLGGGPLSVCEIRITPPLIVRCDSSVDCMSSRAEDPLPTLAKGWRIDLWRTLPSVPLVDMENSRTTRRALL